MDEDTLTTLVVALLRADGFEVTEPAPPPKAAPPTAPTGTQTALVPEWVERLADTLALIVTAFSIMQAGSWFGKDNFIVAIAIGAAIVFLVGNYNGPLRQFLRAIFIELILTIVTLVEAIGKFFEAASKYYGGNFARMVLELVLVPVALGLVADFLRYPAVRNIVDFLQGVIAEARHLAEQAVAFTQRGVADLRTWLTAQVSDVLAYLPQEFDRFRSQVVGNFSQLFASAERRVTRVEGALETGLANATAFIVQEVAGVKIPLQLLGQRVDLMPETVRTYLTGLLADPARAFVASLPPDGPTGPVPPAAVVEALARVTAQIERAAVGETSPQAEALATMADGIRSLAV